MIFSCETDIQIFGSFSLFMGFAYARKLLLRLPSIQMTGLSFPLLIVLSQWLCRLLSVRVCA